MPKPEIDQSKALSVVIPARYRETLGEAVAKMVVDKNDTAAIWRWIIDEGIKPHQQAIDRIVADGSVAVVVFALESYHEEAPRALGWDGVSPVFRMSKETQKRFAASLGQIDDKVAQRWLDSDKKGRVFAFVEDGTLLFNVDEKGNYSLEPASTGQI